MAGILIRSLGLRGFTPVRAARLETRKVPKPVMVTVLPFLRVVEMAPMKASNTSVAAFLVTPAFSAARLIKSCLVIGFWVRE